MDLTVSFLGFGATVGAIILGLKKGGDKIDKIFEKQLLIQQDAIYSFYPQLDSLLTGFDYMLTKSITSDDGSMADKPANVLLFLWAKEGVSGVNRGQLSAQEEVDLLRKISQELLLFFYNTPNQMPPQHNKEEWSINKKSLIKELNKLIIDIDTRVAGIYDLTQIEDRYNRLKGLIKYFSGVINTATLAT
jgi:hypothetical protein